MLLRTARNAFALLIALSTLPMTDDAGIAQQALHPSRRESCDLSGNRKLRSGAIAAPPRENGRPAQPAWAPSSTSSSKSRRSARMGTPHSRRGTRCSGPRRAQGQRRRARVSGTLCSWRSRSDTCSSGKRSGRWAGIFTPGIARRVDGTGCTPHGCPCPRCSSGTDRRAGRRRRRGEHSVWVSAPTV